jgi:hypothetical protein
VFGEWFIDAIKESKFALVWKTLVAYQKLVSLKVSVTTQREPSRNPS